MDAGAVLHITSLPGGGVDRHIRDIARAIARPALAWHVAPTAEALEVPVGGHVFALDPAAVEREASEVRALVASARVGIVHAHSLTRAVRKRASQIASLLGAPMVVTLHDVLFLREDAFDAGTLEPDAEWLAQTAPFLRKAATVLAPSEYVADLARRHVPGLAVQVVPNGSASPAPAKELAARADFATRPPRHVAVVLGAIGPHKGSAILAELDALLAGTDIAIVVIGYLDAQVVPGWRGERLFLHGPYDDRDTTALLRAYGARLVLFPNRVPESFSYALSDAWTAGIPALVPDAGALAERVRRHGGGWILPQDADAATIARTLRELLDGGEAIARVESDLARPDPDRVPSLDAMSRSLDALYQRFGIDPAAAPDGEQPAMQKLLAANLDGALFRVELARMADEYAQLQAAHAQALAQARQFETESRGWIAKLEADIAALQAQLVKEFEARAAAEREKGLVADDLARHQAALGRLPWPLPRLLLRKRGDA